MATDKIVMATARENIKSSPSLRSPRRLRKYDANSAQAYCIASSSEGKSSVSLSQHVGKENECEHRHEVSTKSHPTTTLVKSFGGARKKAQLAKKKLAGRRHVRAPVRQQKLVSDRSKKAEPLLSPSPRVTFVSVTSNLSCLSDPQPLAPTKHGAEGEQSAKLFETPHRMSRPDGTHQSRHSSTRKMRIHHLGVEGGMIRSGPVRIKIPQEKPVERTPKRTMKRIGVDGTPKTPSRELLRSTACSRGKCVKRKEDNPHKVPVIRAKPASTKCHLKSPTATHAAAIRPPSKKIYSPLISKETLADNESTIVADIGALSLRDPYSEEGNDESMDSSIIRAMEQPKGSGPVSLSPDDTTRKFLENPVAITLSNEEEAPGHLLDQDRTPNGGQSPDKIIWCDPEIGNISVEFLARPYMHHIRKLSGSLSDVKSDEEVLALARPIAVPAKGWVRCPKE